MKIICCPDSFKESLTAAEAAGAMARGIRQVMPGAAIDLCPVADGGEGTVDALVAATNGTMHTATVTGPLGEPVEAEWGTLGTGQTAVIEMAAASGLALVPPKHRDPGRTTTFGTGELIRAALDGGAAAIIVGIGGSSTNDGGCGMAQALGATFGTGTDVKHLDGNSLQQITGIDLSTLDPRIAVTTVTVACDVTNPFTGPDGAAYIYGPQKGASPQQVEQLDHGLRNLAVQIREHLHKDIEHMPGAGAAGGLGGGLVAFLDAQLRPGIDVVLEAVRFDQRVQDCDLCLTGEGKLDEQTLSGKACYGVWQAARRHGVKTIAIVGSIGTGAEKLLDCGLTEYHSISDNVGKSEAIRRAAELIEQTTARIVGDLVR